MNQTNVILAGVGGQGVVTAGILIGNAAATSGLNVVMAEIHGMSQRGGAVTVELRTGHVHGPIIPDGVADLVLGFEAVETLRVMNRVEMSATVIMSTERIIPISVNMGDSTYPDIESVVSRLREVGAKLFPIDARGLAEQAGNAVFSNMVLVGAAYSAGFVPVNLSTLQQSARDLFPASTWDANLKALELGMREYRVLKEKSEVASAQRAQNAAASQYSRK